MPFLKSGFFQLIVENAPACIALLRGPDFIFEVVNPAYAAIAPGVSMLGKTVGQVFPDAERVIVPLLAGVLRSGESFRTDDYPVAISKDPALAPEIRYFSFSYTRIADGATPDGHSILVLAVETTNRKNAEDERARSNLELQRQWRTFDTALSNSPDFIYTFNLEGRLTYVNRALLSLWQMPLEDALGKNFFDLQYPDGLAAQLQAQIQSVIATGHLIRAIIWLTKHYRADSPKADVTGETATVSGSGFTRPLLFRPRPLPFRIFLFHGRFRDGDHSTEEIIEPLKLCVAGDVRRW